MIRFNNDYSFLAHPSIVKAIEEDLENSYSGYGYDSWCDKAKDLIKKEIGTNDVDIHFASGGTQTNLIVVDACLKSVQSVICASSGHINVHEAGSVEKTGHKIEAIPSSDEKIHAKTLKAYVKNARESEIAEHITQPGLLYMSFPDEYGNIYSKKELMDIKKVCEEYGMYLFIDGARLGYGLAAKNCDLTIKDITKYSDIYYIGGTKCGAMLGEAIVISNDNLKPLFRNYLKQNGAILAKGWLLGIQFAKLFENGLYFEITRSAVEKAMKIKECFKKAGIKSYIDSNTNQQFVILSKAEAKKLSKDFLFENEFVLEDGSLVVRFCTSWATKDEDVDCLIKAINKL